MACPQALYPPVTANDQFGTSPYVNCTRPAMHDFQNDGLYIFNLSVCRNESALKLHVVHLQGFVDNEANRACSAGPDFITSKVVGPELRLVSACVAFAGFYRVWCVPYAISHLKTIDSVKKWQRQHLRRSHILSPTWHIYL